MSKSIQLKKGTEKYYVHPYFPIGSIYMNITNINPSTYFGGTWERLKDRFLLAVGDTYKENAIGGSANVTLTTSQIPKHTHTYSRSNDNTDSHTLTIDQIPSHKHTIISWRDAVDNTFGAPVDNNSAFSNVGTNGDGTAAYADDFYGIGNTGGSQGHSHTISRSNQSTGEVGGGSPHTNMPPYITVYVWKRVA